MFWQISVLKWKSKTEHKIVAQEAHKTLPETARSEDAKDQEDA
jgi:hypothetical protein